jgi:hypothetical protein
LTLRRYPDFLLLGIIWLAVPAFAAAGPNPAEVRKAAGDVARSLEVQSRLPNDSGTTDAPTDRRGLKAYGLGGDGIYIPGGEVIFSLIQWAIIVVAVIAILAVLAIILREPLEDRLRLATGPPLPLAEEPRAPADARELIARADSLAAAGQFAEAMHCVLLAAMILLGGPAPDKSVDSRTSWELLRSAAIPQTQIYALRDLVTRVERAWFGQRSAGPDDYRHVRGIFDAFHSPAAEKA